MEKREKKKGKEQDPAVLGDGITIRKMTRKTSQNTGTCTNTQRAEDQAVGGIDLVYRFAELHSLLSCNLHLLQCLAVFLPIKVLLENTK